MCENQVHSHVFGADTDQLLTSHTTPAWVHNHAHYIKLSCRTLLLPPCHVATPFPALPTSATLRLFAPPAPKNPSAANVAVAGTRRPSLSRRTHPRLHQPMTPCSAQRTS